MVEGGETERAVTPSSSSGFFSSFWISLRTPSGIFLESSLTFNNCLLYSLKSLLSKWSKCSRKPLKLHSEAGWSQKYFKYGLKVVLYSSAVFLDAAPTERDAKYPTEMPLDCFHFWKQSCTLHAQHEVPATRWKCQQEKTAFEKRSPRWGRKSPRLQYPPW